MILGDPWLVDWAEAPRSTTTCGIRSHEAEHEPHVRHRRRQRRDQASVANRES